MMVVSPSLSNIYKFFEGLFNCFFWIGFTDQHSNMEIHHLYFSKDKGILLTEILRDP